MFSFIEQHDQGSGRLEGWTGAESTIQARHLDFTEAVTNGGRWAGDGVGICVFVGNEIMAPWARTYEEFRPSGHDPIQYGSAEWAAERVSSSDGAPA